MPARPLPPRRNRDCRDTPCSDPYVRLWALRVLAHLHESRTDATEFLRTETRLLVALGVLPRERELESPEECSEVCQRIREEVKSLEERPHTPDSDLDRNLGMLGGLLDLSPLETELLSLAVRMQISEPLSFTYGRLDVTDTSGAYEAMAHMLATTPGEVRKVLGPEGSLRRLGLVRMNRNHYRVAQMPVELLAELDDLLLSAHMNAEDLLVGFFRRAPAARFPLSSFAYLQKPLDLLQRVLAGALGRAEEEGRGVHVLLHGAPGTGKTELCRALAEDLGAELFEVSVESREGEPLSGAHRSAAYRIAQHALARRKQSLLLFDEIEDVFPARSLSPRFSLRPWSADPGPADVEKGWVNQLLEQSSVPSFWVSNAIDHLDPAHLRRFDLILEVRSPPAGVRRAQVEEALAGLPVGAGFIARVADDERMTPASLANLKRLAQLGGEDGDLEGRLTQAWEQRARALGGPARRTRAASPLRWEPRFLHTTPDVGPVVEGLVARPWARVLLHGPPGTGKSALADEVARQSGLPLLSRRASDLLSKWVGGNEKNLAALFDEARDTGAIVLIDEADTFLRDRAQARSGWESSMVNELLVQMEHFEGLFLCSTNLVTGIDPAAFRRFDLKVAFEALRPEQRLWLLEEALGGPLADESLRERALRLRSLTPGDVAALLRRQRVLGGAPEPEAFLAALEADLALKNRERAARVGF